MAEVAAGSSAFVSPPAGRGEETMARLVIRGSGGGVNRWSGLVPDQLLRRACRRNALARAMRRVQLQGGARGPHARRTLCTLSVRPRAPTPQMGPYHRSRTLEDTFLPPAVAERADLEPQGVEVDEPLGVLLPVHAVRLEGREIRPVERPRRLAAGHGHRALVELEPDGAGHVALHLVEQPLERLPFRREPEAVVDHLGVAGHQGVTEMQRF